MPERISTSARSAIMAKVLSHGNMVTELRLIALFRKFKIHGWRRHQRVTGKPDFVFRSHRIAVFVDGCFWHGCRSCYRRPNTNRKYWDEKVVRNRARDQHVNRQLKTLGWRVLRIWGHELTGKNEARLLARIRKHV